MIRLWAECIILRPCTLHCNHCHNLHFHHCCNHDYHPDDELSSSLIILISIITMRMITVIIIMIRLWAECIIVRPCTATIVSLTFAKYSVKLLFPECDPPDERLTSSLFSLFSSSSSLSSLAHPHPHHNFHNHDRHCHPCQAPLPRVCPS